MVQHVRSKGDCTNLPSYSATIMLNFVNKQEYVPCLHEDDIFWGKNNTMVATCLELRKHKHSKTKL